MAKLDLLFSSPVPYLTDGGQETDLIFNDGVELPLFSAFVLLDSKDGRAALRRYFDRYLDVAERPNHVWSYDLSGISGLETNRVT